MKTSSKLLILNFLKNHPGWYTPEEISKHVPNYSINNICTRLSELAKSNLIIGRYKVGKPYKEWSNNEMLLVEHDQRVVNILTQNYEQKELNLCTNTYPDTK